MPAINERKTDTSRKVGFDEMISLFYYVAAIDFTYVWILGFVKGRFGISHMFFAAIFIALFVFSGNEADLL